MSNVPAISVTDAMASPLLFGPFFRSEPMSDREKAAFGDVAAREPPAQRVKELVCVAGRGAGAPRIFKLYVSCLIYRGNITPQAALDAWRSSREDSRRSKQEQDG
jgi:hypothetical protein